MERSRIIEIYNEYIGKGITNMGPVLNLIEHGIIPEEKAENEEEEKSRSSEKCKDRNNAITGLLGCMNNGIAIDKYSNTKICLGCDAISRDLNIEIKHTASCPVAYALEILGRRI